MKSISIAALLLAALFLLPATAKEAAEPAVNASCAATHWCCA